VRKFDENMGSSQLDCDSTGAYMTPQEHLAEFLKSKGIGPKGSKSLKDADLEQLSDLLNHSETADVTKAVLLTAFMMLQNTPAEQQWLESFKNQPQIPQWASFLLEPSMPYASLDHGKGLKILHQVIAGKDLADELAQWFLAKALEGVFPAAWTACFLEAQRLKRETVEENTAFFRVLYRNGRRIELDIPLLVDLADAYDGSNRTYNLTLFSAVTLAAIGVPVVLHGCQEVAPKQGVNTCKIMQNLGLDPFIKLTQAAARIFDSEVGWAYVDQSVSFPSLHAWTPMRKELVKRPFLATFEKMLMPLRSLTGHFLVTGYTHTPYKETIPAVFDNLNASISPAKLLLLRGSEGSTQIPLHKPTTALNWDAKGRKHFEVAPEDLGFVTTVVNPDKSLTASACAQAGLAVLEGQKEYPLYAELRTQILYLAALICREATGDARVSDLANAIDSGLALKHLQAGGSL
jgi:anthranilate phosphoribosyltransferase